MIYNVKFMQTIIIMFLQSITNIAYIFSTFIATCLEIYLCNIEIKSIIAVAFFVNFDISISGFESCVKFISLSIIVTEHLFQKTQSGLFVI